MDKMIMNWLRKIMIGRYGVDPLNKFLLITSLIAMLISNIFGGAILYTIALLVLAYTYFRMLSKNHYKRHQENNRYLYYKNKVLNVFRKGKNTVNQRKVYHIYKCPSCKQKIRIPRGKGRIQITCPKCHTQFIKKS